MVVPPAFHRAVTRHRRADMLVSDGEIFQYNSGVEIDPPGLRYGCGVLRQEVAPAKEAIAAGSEAAEGGPAAGYGGVRDVGENVDVLGAAVADDALRGPAGNDAADGAGVGDGKGSAGTEGIGDGEDNGDDGDGDGERDGDGG